MLKNGQFLVNDKPVYFKGFGKHEDSYVNEVVVLNEAVNLMDLNLMKTWGKIHTEQPTIHILEEMMRLSDRMGFLVIDEVPAVGLFANFTAALSMNRGNLNRLRHGNIMKPWKTINVHLRNLVARDKNHACVVLWSVANEPDGAGRRCR